MTLCLTQLCFLLQLLLPVIAGISLSLSVYLSQWIPPSDERRVAASTWHNKFNSASILMALVNSNTFVIFFALCCSSARQTATPCYPAPRPIRQLIVRANTAKS